MPSMSPARICARSFSNMARNVASGMSSLLGWPGGASPDAVIGWCIRPVAVPGGGRERDPRQDGDDEAVADRGVLEADPRGDHAGEHPGYRERQVGDDVDRGDEFAAMLWYGQPRQGPERPEE